jgi:hypothetical protein
MSLGQCLQVVRVERQRTEQAEPVDVVNLGGSGAKWSRDEQALGALAVGVST